jgi:hypothetical protein
MTEKFLLFKSLPCGNVNFTCDTSELLVVWVILSKLFEQ